MKYKIGFALCILIICGLATLPFIMNSCMSMKDPQVDANEWTEPASVCDYKVNFISTAQYKTLEDFWDVVGWTVIYLNKNGYKVLDIVPKYGRDMTQKEVLMFVYIKYIKEVKNE